MKNPYPINPIMKLVVGVWMWIYTRKYNIRAKISSEIQNINEPYLLLGNHVGRYDPFIQAFFLKKKPNFVSSDAVMRDRIIGTAFKWLGAVPKRKGQRDSQVIREMNRVVQAGGALAIFPEGARTWSGAPLDVDPSIAKLVRLLKIPVVTSTMQGSYAYDPRWAKKVRKAGFEVDYKLVIRKEEIKNLSEEEIFKRICDEIQHDNIAYLEQNKIAIESEIRAESIELILFACPHCNSMNGFTSSGNNFSCKNCNTTHEVDRFGFFNALGAETHFTNTRNWMNWQNQTFVRQIFALMEQPDDGQPILTSGKMNVFYAGDTGPLKPIGQGKITFYRNRLHVAMANREFDLMWDDVDMISPQYLERLELTTAHTAYRFWPTYPEAGIKWELALNAIRYAQGKHTQLSAHFKSILVAASRQETT
jgi:1-acyl-sn-glycerol-3-phosphate acyltransferase